MLLLVSTIGTQTIMLTPSGIVLMGYPIGQALEVVMPEVVVVHPLAVPSTVVVLASLLMVRSPIVVETAKKSPKQEAMVGVAINVPLNAIKTREVVLRLLELVFVEENVRYGVFVVDLPVKHVEMDQSKVMSLINMVDLITLSRLTMDETIVEVVVFGYDAAGLMVLLVTTSLRVVDVSCCYAIYVMPIPV